MGSFDVMQPRLLSVSHTVETLNERAIITREIFAFDSPSAGPQPAPHLAPGRRRSLSSRRDEDPDRARKIDL